MHYWQHMFHYNHWILNVKNLYYETCCLLLLYSWKCGLLCSMFLKTLIGIVICKKVSYFFQEISSHNHNIMYVCTSHVKFSFCLKVNRHDNFNSSILLDDVNFAFQVKFRNKFVPLKFKYIYSKTIIIHRRFLVCFSHMNIKEKKKKILPPYKDNFKKEIFFKNFCLH